MSGVVLGGVAAGSGSGTWAINLLGTQAQAEAGSDTVGRLWAALQLKQAIDVLGALPDTAVSYAKLRGYSH